LTKSEGELTWKDMTIGCIAVEPGNARQYRSGDWRSQRPTHDFTRCIKCGLCQIYCPEGSVFQNDDGYFDADMYHCKGCGICAKECPTGVITMVDEEEK
jgi:pyruvate ferredoxin oxidoreductase delta subunit